jgi:hypothetical protein
MTTRRRRWVIIALAVLGLGLAGIGVAGWLAFRAYAPLLARERIEAALAQALDRPVHIERVLLRPLLGRIVLENVAVSGEAGRIQEPLLRLDRAAATVGISSLWRREVVVSRILLDGLTVRFSGPSTGGAPSSLHMPDRFTAGPIGIRLHTIELRRGWIAWHHPRETHAFEIRGLEAVLDLTPTGIDLTARASDLAFKTPGVSEAVEDLRGEGRILADRVEIGELNGRWQGSHVRLRGTVHDPLGAPSLLLSLKGEFDLASLSRRAGPDWAVTGTASAEGDIHGRLDALAASGRVRLPDLTVGPVKARQVVIRARLADGLLRFEDLRAQVFGGQLQGSLSLPLARPEGMQTSFTLTNGSIEALEALAPGRVGLRGTVTLEAALHGDPRRLESLQGQTRLSASGVGLPGEFSRIGLGTVSVEAAFRGAQVEVRRATGEWPGIRTDLNGRLSPQGLAPLRLTLRADLGAVAALWGEKRLAGQAQLAAEASGRWDTPEVAGRLEAPSLDLGGTPVRDARVPFRFSGRKLQIDSAALTLGRSRISASGSSTWGGGITGAFKSLAQELRFRLDVRAPAARLEDLASWLPAAWRGAGRFAISGSVEGTSVAWRGTGLVEADRLTMDNRISIQGLRVNLLLDPARVTLAQVDARVAGIPLAGSGAYAWDGTGRASATIGPAGLEAIPGVPGQAALSGTGRAHLEVAFHPGDVRGEGRVLLHGVSVLGVPAGDGTVLLTLRGRDFRTTLAFPRIGLSGEAMGPLDEEGSLDLRLLVKDLALAPFLNRALPENVPPFSGTVSAAVQATVPFRHPKNARMTIRLDPIRLSLGGEDWENRGPVALRWDQGTLFVDRFELASRLGGVSGAGRLNPSGDIDLGVTGGFPLALLPALWPEVREAGGQLEVAARINGTVAAPRMTGEGAIRGGRLLFAAYPEALRDLEARFLLSESGLRLIEATGSLGRGRLRASGNVGLDGGRLGGYQLTLAGQDVSFAPIERLVTTWNLTLALVGQGSRASLSGEARLTRGSYTGDLSLLSLVLAKRTGKPAAPSLVIPLRITLRLENDLAVETKLARLRPAGTLRLEGTTAEPILFGTLEAHEGQIQFRRNRMALLWASARFDDPRRIDPYLDVRAEGWIKGYDVTLGLTGRSDSLEVKLSSTPPLPRDDLLALVTFGVTREELTRSGAGLFLGEAANLLVHDLLGVDIGGVGPEVLEVETKEKGDRTVRVGKRVTEQTLVTYSQAMGGSSERKVRVEYELVGPLLIAGEQNFQGSYGADLLLRFRFR